jgi:hypothetical protein
VDKGGYRGRNTPPAAVGSPTMARLEFGACAGLLARHPEPCSSGWTCGAAEAYVGIAKRIRAISQARGSMGGRGEMDEGTRCTGQCTSSDRAGAQRAKRECK